MTFDSRERSDDQGAPIELYEFVRATTRYYYTSTDRDVVVSGNTYKSATITRGAIEASTDVDRAAMRLSVPRTLDVAGLFVVSPPSDPVGVVISAYHDGDGEVVVNWQGVVVAADFRGVLVDLVCSPAHLAMRRVGLRRVYSRTCTHVLYGGGDGRCNVNKEAYKVTGTVVSVTSNGLVFTVNEFGAYAANHFAGGYIEFAPVTGAIDRRFIVSHSGTSVTLAQPATALVAGMSVSAFPGCDHTLATCHTKFNNVANYGGQPWIPSKNPFGGDPVF